MIQAASHLADRKELRGAMQNGRLSQAEGGRIRMLYRQRAGCLWQGHLPLGDDGVYEVDNLTSMDQVIPDWFKIPFLGEVETIIKLDIKSQFDDGGLRQVTPF